MSMTTITRHFRIDAGHRVWGHESKCAHLHGHSYSLELTVCAEQLDSLGRIIDFGVVKDVVGSWVDTHWDHNVLLHPEDPLIGVLAQAENGRAPWIMSYGNPTAENIAREFFEISTDLLKQHQIIVTKARVYETPNCWADYVG